MDGFQLMEKIRSLGIPTIFLTARNGLTDKVKGLKLGADDYIIKPFEAVELLARIEAVLRRCSGRKKIIINQDLEINLEERTVKKEGKTVDLTMKEYELLILLIRNRNKALTREKILEQVWGYEYEGETRTIDIHIQKLRKKTGLENQYLTHELKTPLTSIIGYADFLRSTKYNEENFINGLSHIYNEAGILKAYPLN